MAHISSRKPKGLFQRMVAWMCRREFGRTPGAVGAFFHHPALLRGMVSMERAFLKARAVPEALRSLADLRAATRIGCAFCIDFGSMVSQRRGVTAAQIRALPDYETSPLFSETERDVLRLTDAMCDTPAAIPRALVERLVATFGERGVVELVAAIGWENYRARVNHALGLGSEGYSTGGVCALPVPARAAGTIGQAAPVPPVAQAVG